MPTIVVLIGTDEDKTHHYFGTFKDGTEACHWARYNCKGFEWYWEELKLVNLPDPVMEQE